VFLEEGAPFIIEKDLPFGLEGCSQPGQAAGTFDGSSTEPPKKIEFNQRRLSALPRYRHRGVR